MIRKNVKLPHPLNVRNFTALCFHNSIVKFDVFPGSHEKYFFGIITDNEFNWIALKNIRKNVISFKLSWYKIFIH